jgi:hypothetical protein
LTAQLAKVGGDPIGWHRDFILHVVVPHAHFFGYLVAYGEIAIGISLLVGCLVRISSSFGAFLIISAMFRFRILYYRVTFANALQPSSPPRLVTAAILIIGLK